MKHYEKIVHMGALIFYFAFFGAQIFYSLTTTSLHLCFDIKVTLKLD